MGMSASKEEKYFLSIVNKFPDQVCISSKNSAQEGFEYFSSIEYCQKTGNNKPSLLNKLKNTDRKNSLKMIGMFAKMIPKMMKSIGQGFKDSYYLLDRLSKNGQLNHDSHQLLESYPNRHVWNELVTYAWNKWKVKVGFTYMPNELIFKGKAVLYPYALVLIQEMDKGKIAKAPEFEAGKEVFRVYAELGIAVNDIANWLRDNYQLDCHSNHPLGGLVNTTPLAVKAGMGWQGHNGLLITPEFGQRQRIAPIFIESKIFEYTDSDEHKWIEQFCKNCKKCERQCPSNAIYSEKQISVANIEGLGETRTCIDREKCYPYFNKTMGCSICVKVCPFSAGGDTYYKLKNAITKKNCKI